MYASLKKRQEGIVQHRWEVYQSVSVMLSKKTGIEKS